MISSILSVSFAWGVLLSTSTDTLLGRIVAASNSSPERLVDLVIFLTSPSSDSKTCGTVAIEPLTSFVSPGLNSPGSMRTEPIRNGFSISTQAPVRPRASARNFIGDGNSRWAPTISRGRSRLK